MNTKILICLAALAVSTAGAQTTPSGTTRAGMPTYGTWEFTLNGTGTTNKDVDDSLGGVNLSIGRYISENFAWAIRQGVTYSNPDDGGSQWFGSTNLAFDRYFGTSAWRPFLGINAGGLYGDSVQDTWSAGLETGTKYYVNQSTFIQGMVEYGWLFDDGADIDDRFDDGRWTWNVGVGFNF